LSIVDPPLLVVAVALMSAAANLLVHYESLRALSFLVQRVALKPRQKILFLVGGTLFAHLCEIILFAVAFWFFFDLDSPATVTTVTAENSLYLSIESYTSLGTSTGFPIGQMRLLAGMEALTGLILIGWTVSFTYLYMREFWTEH
jgi:hypothetical protein